MSDGVIEKTSSDTPAKGKKRQRKGVIGINPLDWMAEDQEHEQVHGSVQEKDHEQEPEPEHVTPAESLNADNKDAQETDGSVKSELNADPIASQSSQESREESALHDQPTEMPEQDVSDQGLDETEANENCVLSTEHAADHDSRRDESPVVEGAVVEEENSPVENAISHEVVTQNASIEVSEDESDQENRFQEDDCFEPDQETAHEQELSESQTTQVSDASSSSMDETTENESTEIEPRSVLDDTSVAAESTPLTENDETDIADLTSDANAPLDHEQIAQTQAEAQEIDESPTQTKLAESDTHSDLSESTEDAAEIEESAGVSLSENTPESDETTTPVTEESEKVEIELKDSDVVADNGSVDVENAIESGDSCVPPGIREVQDEDARMKLEGPVTIADVSELYSKFKEAIASGESLTIDCSNVESMDASALQLLTVVSQEATNQGIELKWDEPSEPMLNAADLLGLRNEIRL